MVLVKSRRKFDQVCTNSDIIIAPFSITRPCGTKLLIYKAAPQKDGAHAIYFLKSSMLDNGYSHARGILRDHLSYIEKPDAHISNISVRPVLIIVTVRVLRGNWPWNL